MRSSIDFPALPQRAELAVYALAQETFLFTNAATANRLLTPSFR